MNIGRDTAGHHRGDHMRHTYQKNSRETRQENTRGEFWGNWRYQRSNMTMALSHYALDMRGSRPTSAGTQQRINGGAYDICLSKIQEKQGRRTRTKNFGVIGEIFCRATNLRVQRMGWGAGIPTGRWVIVERRKENQSSEEWGGKQRMGPL